MFYRRELPSPPAIAFSSKEGKTLFAESLQDGTLEVYFRLAEQFRTQDEPAFCGLSTLTMVLNSLAVDPKKVWKGVWRWYHESMLECCRPLEEVRKDGISFDELACLARCNSLQVLPKRPTARHEYDNEKQVEPRIVEQAPPRNFFDENQKDNEKAAVDCNAGMNHPCTTNSNKNTIQDDELLHPYDNYCSLKEFRDDIVKCCCKPNGPILIISYSRKELLQTGDGHFSPIGGYHRNKDMVLILDTARFKYPPHWVNVEMLYNSMCRLDPSKNLTRGWMIWDVAKELKKESGLHENEPNAENNSNLVPPLNKSGNDKSFVSTPPPQYFTFFNIENNLVPSEEGEAKYGSKLTVDASKMDELGIKNIENDSTFSSKHIQAVLMDIEVKMTELVSNNTRQEKSFLEESKNIDVPSNSKKGKYDLFSPPKCIQTSSMNYICNGTTRHALYFRSPIAFSPKCCAEDEKDDKNLEMWTEGQKPSCKMNSKCSSKNSCNGHELLFRGIRSTRLYQGVKEALSSEDYTKKATGVPEMYTLLLLVLCNDDNLMTFQESSQIKDKQSTASISERSTGSSLRNVKPLCEFSYEKYPELSEELKSLTVQWKVLKDYCRVVLKLPVIDFVI